MEEIVELRRRGFRFIASADDNFYPVTLTDIELAKRQKNQSRVDQLQAMREERFELMERLSELPEDMTFFTQITMEAAEDTGFLDAMKKARIKGALSAVEPVTAAALKSVHQDFNLSGESPDDDVEASVAPPSILPRFVGVPSGCGSWSFRSRLLPRLVFQSRC